MGRPLAKLSATRVEKLSKTPGMHGDGGGLWLCVTSAHAASWLYRFQITGKAREMGLGPYDSVSLAQARELATDARRLKAAGVDPIEQRKAVIFERRASEARALTFRQCAQNYMASEKHLSGVGNAKYRKQWEATLEAYAYPVIGGVAVQAIDVAMINRILRPIWPRIPDTANRLRRRIETVLNWATTEGARTGENPARWKGHLENHYSLPSKTRPTQHHAALPYSDISEFVSSLRRRGGGAARALELLILTAARTSEIIGARWEEFDLQRGLWTVPAIRMKAGKEHRVPLSDPALTVLRALRSGTGGSGLVFPGLKRGRPISSMAMAMLLRRMDRGDLTVHGFRSTFKDWATECTNFPAEVVEVALAHAVADRTVAAYQRGDIFEKRRRLMDAWANYCSAAADADVIPIRRTAG